MKKSSLVLLFAMLTVVIQGCKKDSKDDPAPNPTGRILGQLKLTDELGVEFSDHSGMTISVSGSNWGVSASAGSYEINNLATGTYHLTYQKAGFGTYKRFNVQVLAGSNATTLNGVDYLGQTSTTEVSGLSANFNPGDSTYTIQCTIAPTPDPVNQRAFRIFFGKSNMVSAQDYHFTPSNTWLATTATGQITGFPVSQFYNNGFVSGETVYVIAYGESIRTNSYTDPATNKKVFPNVNSGAPSNVATFILP